MRREMMNASRSLYEWTQVLLLDLQRMAHQSLADACFVLDWIHDAFVARQKWTPELEPLLEQLRQTPSLSRARLVDTFLLAGLYGAQYRWLETRCHISEMAATVSSSGHTMRLYRMYYAKAQADDQLMWFP
jgi:hypothetical protein